jgi:hypothetical protein
MEQDKIDKIEAGNQISKEGGVQQFVSSTDWKVIKKMLFEKLLQLDSLSVLYEGTKRKTIKNNRKIICS